jgi:hypothetical protein
MSRPCGVPPRQRNATKTVGRCVGEKVGITDKRKAPNRSWRHRFVDQCRATGIARDVRFALDGHAGRDEGDEYGSEGVHKFVLMVDEANAPT